MRQSPVPVPSCAVYRRPRPPWRAGAKLLRAGYASAAIDVSDGLAQDLGHLLRESGVGADLDLERLPLARGQRPLCRRLGLDPTELALSAGEDYELLFCVGPRAPEASVITRRLGCPVREIGRIRRGRGLRLFRARSQGWRAEPRLRARRDSARFL